MGNAAIPNGVGVLVSGLAMNNIIGGTAPGEGNVISGNREDNVLLGSTGNRVQGNRIGTNAAGTTAPTNLAAGTFASGVNVAVSNNTVGGSVGGAGNIIAFNTAYGIFVSDINIQNNSLLGNSIFSNGQIGINLLGKDGPGGVTFNNQGPFNVANRGQNFPVISSTAGNVISATFNAEASKTYRLEFFASDAADPTNFGEGQTFLGFVNKTTDGAGNTPPFTFTSPIDIAGEFISATATDSAGNTSEFSGAVEAASGGCSTVVTTTADSGAGSLREALNCSNSTPGKQTISFNIPGAGVKTIAPLSRLPSITDAVTIDGYTQPGARPNTLAVGSNTVLLIEINGANVPGGIAFAITESGGGSTLRGLVINRASPSLQIRSGGNIVEGCFFNTNPAGTAAMMLANGLLGGGISIVQGDGNRIGGTTPAARNVIVADSECVRVGNQPFPKPANTLVQGNYIGTNAQGTAALNGPGFVGINVRESSNTVIGGLTPTPGTGAGNLISGNGTAGFGILINLFGTVADLEVVTIQGNLIGTNASGTAAIPNKQGVVVGGLAMRALIGGPQAGARNVISGNGIQSFVDTGILVTAETSVVTVQNNFIGTALNGTTPLPNIGDGIRTESSAATLNLIGGTGANQGNVIANNARTGVNVAANLNTFTGKATIQGNSIFNNGGIGIDLGLGVSGPVVTPNDPGDTDLGVNGRQNFPEFTSVNTVNNSTRAIGRLNSLPNKTYRLEFFASTAADASGFGEGQTFLGAQNVTTNAQSLASFDVTFANSAGSFITATATDPDGNTSEFSAAFLTATLTPATATTPVGTPHTVTFILRVNNVAQAGTTVNFAVSGANQASGTATTNAQGQATFTYTGQNAGTDGIGATGSFGLISFSATATKIWTAAAVPIISVNDVTVTEGNTGTANATFTLTLSRATNGPVTVRFSTRDNEAVAPGDYTAVNRNVTIPAGQTTATVNVPVIGDNIEENNELFTVVLTNPQGATLAKAQGNGTILNDDTATISINDVRLTEGPAQGAPAGAKNFVFTVSLSNPSAFANTVNFATANGSATAGSDYVARSGAVTFAAGETTKTIAVVVNGDTVVETDETFFVNISQPVVAAAGRPRAVFGKTRGLGTIVNDDQAALPTLSINNVSVTEGPAQGAPAGTKSATFTVTLSAPSNAAVTVRFATANGTATAGSDYVARNGTLTFPAGTTTQTIAITINGDTTVEPNETFTVNLSNATGATIAAAQGNGTIRNDDVPPLPTLSINNVNITEGPAQGAPAGTRNANLTVTLSAARTVPVTVRFATANGTATAAVTTMPKPAR